MLTLWRLNRHHELIVVRSFGVSVWQTLMPLAVGAATVGVLELVAFNPVSAALYAAVSVDGSERAQAPVRVGGNQRRQRLVPPADPKRPLFHACRQNRARNRAAIVGDGAQDGGRGTDSSAGWMQTGLGSAGGTGRYTM